MLTIEDQDKIIDDFCRQAQGLNQSEVLTLWWRVAIDQPSMRYEMLRLMNKIARGKKQDYPPELLKKTRSRFITNNYRDNFYPDNGTCFLHPAFMRPGTYLVKHHIVMLSRWGCNRRINIVTLCNHCHAYFHPWLFKDIENRNKQLQLKIRPSRIVARFASAYHV